MANTPNIKFDLEALLAVFDELLPVTNEQQKDYWLRKKRQDGVTVTLNFSVYENQAGIIIRNSPDVSPASVNLRSCFQINVLEKHCVELVGGGSSEIRC